VLLQAFNAQVALNYPVTHHALLLLIGRIRRHLNAYNTYEVSIFNPDNVITLSSSMFIDLSCFRVVGGEHSELGGRVLVSCGVEDARAGATGLHLHDLEALRQHELGLAHWCRIFRHAAG